MQFHSAFNQLRVDRFEAFLDQQIRKAETSKFKLYRRFLVALSDWWWDLFNISPSRRRGWRKCWRLA